MQRIFPPLPEVPDFDPEYVDSYELGFKYNNDDGTFSLNGAAFFMDYDDIQVRAPVGIAQVEQNVGTAEVNGVELEMKWQPVETWFVEAGLGYTNAKFTELNIDPSTTTANLSDRFLVIQKNNEFDHVPEWSANVSVSKELDLDESGILLVRLSGNYHSGYFNDPLNQSQIATPEIDLWDLTFLWTSPAEVYSVNAGIKNLTDEEYLATGYFNPTIGTIENIFDRGRQWYLSARYNF